MGPQKFIVVLVCAVALSTCQNEVELPEDAKTFNFSSQGITQILTDFSGYSELEEIDYSNNDIIKINPAAFELNAKLKNINLSGNRKLILPEDGPFLISTAKMLNLSNCNIEKIPGNALDGMKKLEVLDLTNNPIDFENSLAFGSMKYPPRKIIVSEISETDLLFVCRHVDMTVVVKRENRKELECKDVRKGKGELGKSQNIEMASQEDDNVDLTIIEEHLLKAGTHMEMMSDQPDEGSGDDAGEVGNVQETGNGEVTSEDDNEATVKALDAAGETAVPSDNGTIEESTENSEIKPVVIDGTGAHDEIVPDATETHEEEKVEDHEEGKIEDREEEITEVPEEEKIEDHEEDHQEEKAEVPVLIKPGKGRSKIAPKPVATEEVDAEEQAVARGLPVETIVTENTANINKTGDKIKASSDPAVGETLEETTSATSSIVLVLIIAVVVIGSALVGFKYYKSRKPTYAVVNGTLKDESTEGKELQEIVTVKPESQPLMEPRSDVQFEEVNEKTGKDEAEDSTKKNAPAEDATKNDDATAEDTPKGGAAFQDNNKSDTL